MLCFFQFSISSAVLCQNVAGTSASEPHHKRDTRDSSVVNL